jgi:hypothetical protein
MPIPDASKGGISGVLASIYTYSTSKQCKANCFHFARACVATVTAKVAMESDASSSEVAVVSCSR